jgi:hypothetical protein
VWAFGLAEHDHDDVVIMDTIIKISLGEIDHTALFRNARCNSLPVEDGHNDGHTIPVKTIKGFAAIDRIS